jgi:hypothetical protein
MPDALREERGFNRCTKVVMSSPQFTDERIIIDAYSLHVPRGRLIHKLLAKYSIRKTAKLLSENFMAFW